MCKYSAGVRGLSQRRQSCQTPCEQGNDSSCADMSRKTKNIGSDSNQKQSHNAHLANNCSQISQHCEVDHYKLLLGMC